ncbi:hypothetical protein NFJ02_29g68970 [Pycnococcus provasolii]
MERDACRTRGEGYAGALPCAHERQSLERVARFRLGKSAPAAHAAACHAAAALLTTAGVRGSSRPNASDSASKSPEP